MPHTRTLTLTLVVVLGCLASLPTAAAATSISGSVTVENGTADGAQVTVVPVSETLQRVGDPARTTVHGSSFSVAVADAPRYAVRVAYGGTTHYEVLRNGTHASIHLSERITGKVVDDEETPLSGVSVEVLDGDGLVVTTVETGANGTFAVGPVEANETYRLRATVDGVPYRRSVDAAANDTVTIRTRPPTTDTSVLNVATDTRTAYVLQVVPPKNDSGVTSVIQTVTLRNTADRPFVGTVDLPIPTSATPYAGMVKNREAAYRRTETGARLNVTVPAGGTARIGVAYDLAEPQFETTVRRDTPSVTIVLQGYDPAAVNHSANLRVGDAPIPLLVSDGPVSAGETIRLDLTDARSQQTASAAAGADATTDAQAAAETKPSESSSIPSFPGLEILGAVGGMVVVGLVGYRLSGR
ncbi:MAG: carboxypeptidase regulatory-like domain-containing protein [Haloplanus sp.]